MARRNISRYPQRAVLVGFEAILDVVVKGTISNVLTKDQILEVQYSHK
jgi:hypothetical protein